MIISEIVARMDPPRYTTSQAAALVGRHVDTVKRWRDEEIYVPSDKATFGSIEVWLYTHEDIVAMRGIAKHIRPGRRPGDRRGMNRDRADTGKFAKGDPNSGTKGKTRTPRPRPAGA